MSWLTARMDRAILTSWVNTSLVPMGFLARFVTMLHQPRAPSAWDEPVFRWRVITQRPTSRTEWADRLVHFPTSAEIRSKVGRLERVPQKEKQKQSRPEAFAPGGK